MEPQDRIKRPQEEANGSPIGDDNGSNSEPASKKIKLDSPSPADSRAKGVAPIKAEYLIFPPGQKGRPAQTEAEADDDDAAEGRTAPTPQETQQAPQKDGKRKNQRGQNKEREFGTFSDAQRLCNTIAWTPEFSPRPCKHGDRCNALHDLRKYLKEGRRPDITTFGGKCPVWEKYGKCPSGWRCLFVHSHMDEIKHDDGRSELVLVGDASKAPEGGEEAAGEIKPGVVNMVPVGIKYDLSKKRIPLEKSEQYLAWLAKDTKHLAKHYQKHKDDETNPNDYRAQYVEPPFKPSEKRRLYFGRETPVLAPLTTQGNLPFRRLCVELGAQVTYSEMALGLPLLQGLKADWTLMRAHESEIVPPRFNPSGPIVQGYDNSKDLKFGAQIAANAPWVAVKATEALSQLLPHLRLVDLNCGCPVDAVFKSGSGSALLDSHSKLERMIRGMNAVSGDVPITAKIRMGSRDGKLTAQKLVERLALGSEDLRDMIGAPGCAAVTLHGRTRLQRYTRAADWGYIAECAALIKQFNEKSNDLADTIREADENTLPNGGKMYFLGNGDCYSHVEYFDHVDNAKVDSVMIGRGALVKPWVFEEIEKGQYLDKSSSERLTYIEKFVRYGMEAWGSDELGLNYTRRFLLEFLSFFCRYVPIGLLERLPPNLNERPPAYRGRDDLETLFASKNYKDWIKISEMFLGPAPPGFKFQPKHKSNSYEIEAEG
ncbi:tRNA-dihydrouridine(47) synthase [NAD(P)(+)] [Chaetomium tenue]|uniref:tRNA-dihydrouridine(47) synthase [NAD(P)(+)] n=1 Tax=Chaetomium tenue TaxID=1854479 RepID=A0ACB7PP51_9PEZI|nr:tRNA-dihydrouridine(47) synthase [NAD(P)(+)] [Chaetomium globosum]